jgi:predicted hotdog family 3-hydroxylacyl-ACP dehydratase
VCSSDLRRDDQLSPLALIEYGAQAMAVHAALLAEAAGGEAESRLLVSAQAVEFDCTDVALLPAPLEVEAQRQLADAHGALYSFAVRHGEQRYAWGRVAVLRASSNAG